MELQAVTMAKPEARARFLEYRKAVRARHGMEDEQIMRGYRALARGHQVISLGRTITNGGVEETGRPRLAVCRADASYCWVQVSSEGAVTFSASERATWRPAMTRSRVELPGGTLPAPPNPWKTKAHAMVPIVPPALRPADDIANYHVLFEADWKSVPPKDPALLKKIGGDLYAVVAVWDLTEVERLVLFGRKTPTS